MEPRDELVAKLNAIEGVRAVFSTNFVEAQKALGLSYGVGYFIWISLHVQGSNCDLILMFASPEVFIHSGIQVGTLLCESSVGVEMPPIEMLPPEHRQKEELHRLLVDAKNKQHAKIHVGVVIGE